MLCMHLCAMSVRPAYSHLRCIMSDQPAPFHPSTSSSVAYIISLPLSLPLSHVYIYIYIHIYVCICIHVCIHVCICAYMYRYTHEVVARTCYHGFVQLYNLLWACTTIQVCYRLLLGCWDAHVCYIHMRCALRMSVPYRSG